MRLSEIQIKPCLDWFIARDTVPHTAARRYRCMKNQKLAETYDSQAFQGY
jgi:hypothetical protein